MRDDSKNITVPHGNGTITGHPEAIRLLKESMAKQKALRARWPENTREAMSVLCRSFPTLRDADGIAPWNVDRFIHWLNGPAPGSGAVLSGLFVLGVWNGDTDWTECGLVDKRGGKFNVFTFLSVADEEHRAAFLAWCEAPFWP